MIYILQKRYSHKTLDYRVTSDEVSFAVTRGQAVDEPVEVADVNDRSLNEIEVLDFQGNVIEALVSERMLACLQEVDPAGEQYSAWKAVVTNRPEIDQPLYLVSFDPQGVPRTVIDCEKSKLHIDEDDESVSDIFGIGFTDDFEKSMAGKHLMFGIEEFGNLCLFVTRTTAELFDRADLTGMKLFGSENYFDGARYHDPYLNPDHPPFHSVSDQEKWERPASIIDDAGPKRPTGAPGWDPEYEITSWDEL